MGGVLLADFRVKRGGLFGGKSGNKAANNQRELA